MSIIKTLALGGLAVAAIAKAAKSPKGKRVTAKAKTTAKKAATKAKKTARRGKRAAARV
jgi:hypothetical protein